MEDIKEKEKSIREENPKRKRFSLGRNWVISLFIFFSLFSFIVGYLYYQIFSAQLDLDKNKETYVYIKSSDNFDQVMSHLAEKKMISHPIIFEWLAKFSGYPKKIRPGKYKISAEMNVMQLLRSLKSGRQEAVRIAIENIRTKEQLAGKVAAKIEADSMGILSILRDPAEMAKYNLDSNSSIGLFIPDTYEFYWATDPRAFIKKMSREFEKFWNKSRKEKAQALQLKPSEVMTLASIIQLESNDKSEWPVIAGVYLNRLRIGMKLQADPTVVFANGNFKLRRIRGVLDTNSPYNTYLNPGLPPGPIYMPSKACIDSTLNPQQHNFIFFCANAQKPGTHIFAQTWFEHKLNALNYQRYLDNRGIN